MTSIFHNCEDIVLHIAEFCDINSIINLVISSKCFYKQSKYILQKNQDIAMFDSMYGKNAFIKILCGCNKNKKEVDIFKYDSEDVEKSENIIKMLKFQISLKNDKNTKLAIIYKITDILKKKRCIYFNKQRKDQYKDKKFEKFIENTPLWNKCNINIFYVYILFHFDDNNYGKLFDIVDKNKLLDSMIIKNEEDFVFNLSQSIKIFMNFIENCNKNIGKVCGTYIMFDYIFSNVDSYKKYKNNKRINGLNEVFILKIKDIQDQIKDIEELCDTFKNMYINRLEKIRQEFDKIYQ